MSLRRKILLYKEESTLIMEIQCIKTHFKGYYKFVFLHVTDEKNSTENQDYFEVKPTIHFYVPPKSKDLKIQIQ